MSIPRAVRVGHGETSASVLLTYEARYVRRKRMETTRGEAFLLDLPEPTDLREGDALVREDGRAVRVVAAEEPLAEMRAAGRTLARLAWHIGNRHLPAQVEADRILIARDHVIADMLAGLGAEVVEVTEPFTPERGAYSGYSHGNGNGNGLSHVHAHGHQDDHGHAHATLKQPASLEAAKDHA